MNKMLRQPENPSQRLYETKFALWHATAGGPVLDIHGSDRCALFARMPAPTALCPLQHPASARVLTSLLCRRPGASRCKVGIDLYGLEESAGWACTISQSMVARIA